MISDDTGQLDFNANGHVGVPLKDGSGKRSRETQATGSLEERERTLIIYSYEIIIRNRCVMFHSFSTSLGVERQKSEDNEKQIKLDGTCFGILSFSKTSAVFNIPDAQLLR